ncbi:MAG: magnesium chelatase domain-containing protein, partial [Bdellovibrionota bacterium]
MKIAAPLNSEAQPVLQWIEIASSLQIPHFQIIGLPGPEVAEARERIRAAIDSSGFEFPRRRVVLNLSPASIRKRGTGLDLAMAIAVLASHGDKTIPAQEWVAWGELGLDGAIKPAYQTVRTLSAAWTAGVKNLLISSGDLSEFQDALHWMRDAQHWEHPEPRLHAAEHLRDAWELILHPEAPPMNRPEGRTLAISSDHLPSLLPLSTALERALATSAVGLHHFLVLGSRGTGKSHAMEWLTTLFPKMSAALCLDHAILSELMDAHGHPVGRSAPDIAPIRRISPQARPSALIGGTSAVHLRPGEFSLAHGGILIADEFPEWPRDSREALREPLERGKITITRASGSF